MRALVAAGALIGVAGEPEARSQATHLSDPPIPRTAWGDPDIAGTYVRPPGLSPVYCGAAKNVIVMPPVYEGVTQITQSPRYVMFRNQFTRNSRTVLLDGRHGEPPRPEGYIGESRARWEEATLVVTSVNLHPKLVVALTQRDAVLSQDVRVVERFTPVENGVLEYEFAVEDPSMYSGGLRIAFTLAPTGSRNALGGGPPPCAPQP
jgi:hypothetical protein